MAALRMPCKVSNQRDAIRPCRLVRKWNSPQRRPRATSHQQVQLVVRIIWFGCISLLLPTLPFPQPPLGSVNSLRFNSRKSVL